MASKTLTYILGLLFIGLITWSSTVSADVDDNEVGDAPLFYMLQGVKVYDGDRQCAMVGGYCVHTSDCLEPSTNKGLCASNGHRGVECCYVLKSKMPMRPAPCDQHLGACMDRCHKTLMRPGTDCEQGQVCCVLI